MDSFFEEQCFGAPYDETEYFDNFEKIISDEDEIDSDIEVALYSQIHHVENPSFENFSTSTADSGNVFSLKADNEDKKDVQIISERLSTVSKQESVFPKIIDISSESEEIEVKGETIRTKCGKEEKYHKKRCKNFKYIILSDSDESIKKASGSREVHNSKDSSSTVYRTSNINKKVITPVSFIDNSQKNHNPSKIVKRKRSVNTTSSEDDFSFDFPFDTESNEVLINVEHKEQLVKKSYDELWQVNFKDLYPNKALSRYYNKQMRVMCYNCKERGHHARTCTKEKKPLPCFLCGNTGHVTTRCLNPACRKCLSIGHLASQCKWLNHTECCDICEMQGHIKEECPDLWRRYHLTITGDNILPGKRCRNKRIFCYNCSANGHFGYECKRKRMDENSCPAFPFIASYEDPTTIPGIYSKKYKKKTAKNQKYLKKLSRRIEKLQTKSIIQNNEQSTPPNKKKKKKERNSSKNKDLANKPLKKLYNSGNKMEKEKSSSVGQCKSFLQTFRKAQATNLLHEDNLNQKKKRRRTKRKRLFDRNSHNRNDDDKPKRIKSEPFCIGKFVNAKSLLHNLVPELSFSLNSMKFLSDISKS